MFPLKLSTLAAAAAAVLAAIPAFTQAVELGDLTVVSRPGQPLDAVLEVDDVDITVSPLLVRVAPPATYLREGVEWPLEAQDLKMARMGSEAGQVRVKVVGGQSLSSGFPLLIEMNAGGKVTVRSYRLDPVNGVYQVTAAAEAPAALPKPIVRAAAAEKAPAEQPAEAAKPVEAPVQTASAEAPERTPNLLREKVEVITNAAAPVQEAEPAAESAAKTTQPVKVAEPVEAAEAAPKKKAKRGRYAPRVVREYVAVNGFNPNEAFKVQRDMTLWSIAKLYWPTCPGSMLEQVAVALTQRNPKAFMDGDPSRIMVGEDLMAPTSDEIFAIDPMEAFQLVHGATTPVPEATQTLIDAQKRSREAAGEVAAAQMSAKAKGAGAEKVAEAGRAALAAWEADQKKAAEAGAPTAAEPQPNESQVQAAPETPAAAPADAEKSESQAAAEESAAPAEAQTAAAEKTEAAQEADAEEPAKPAEAAAEQKTVDQQSEEKTQAPGADKADKAAAEPQAMKNTTEEAAPEEEKRPLISYVLILAGIGMITFAAWRKRRAEAAKKAEAEAEEKKKAAQGVVAFQRDVAPAEEAQLKAVEATVGEAVKNGTTAGAMGVGAMAYTEAQMKAEREEREKRAQAEAAEKTEEASEAAEAENKKKQSEDQPWLKTEANDKELPPLAAEPVPEKSAGSAENLKDVNLNLEAQANAAPAAAPAAEAQAPAEPARPMNEKERARLEAIDAKLNLAQSFLGLEAKKEALELLAEVKKEGSEAQRAAAQRLLDEAKNAEAGR